MDTTYSKDQKFKRMLVSILSIFVILAIALPNTGFSVQAAQTGELCYVNWDAKDANNGTSWADAYTDLQAALGASTCTQVWVAAGTYKPGTTRDDSFTLKEGVALYGGFAGTETQLTERELAANFTILSGDIGTINDQSDNSYHVLTAIGVNSSTVLDGFTVTEGNANIEPNDRGGGMYNLNSNPSLTNMTFSSNSATWGSGAGMYNDHSNPSLTNATFNSNSAAWGGGGMYNYFSDPILMNVSFNNNSAGQGGAIFNFSGSPSLTNVAFAGNLAEDGGGGIRNVDSNPILTNVTFSNNSVGHGDGGGISNGNSNPTLTNVTFSGNSANSGGGVANFGSSPNLMNVTFNGNSASFGAGLYNYFSNPTITNSILYGDAVSGAVVEIYNENSVPVVTYSIVWGGYPGNGNRDGDPRLGPFQDNGGFTQTMALGIGSAAIDVGDSNNCPSTDQRGEPRPVDGNGDGNAVCDIGAFEAGEITLSPWFTAFPEQEAVEGWDWPFDSLVHLTIDDPATDAFPDYEQDKTVTLTPWGSGQLWVWFDFADAYNMKPGDVVTLTDGRTPRMHMVQNLSITAVDHVENTVSGTADANQPITLWSWEDTEGKRVETMANDSGNWTANFNDVNFDLAPGYHVRAEVWDGTGNDTAVDWEVPTPSSAAWRDEFNGPLAEDWHWVNEDEDKWMFNLGLLRVFTSPYATGGQNLLLRPVAQGDFVIKTHMLFEPNANFQFAGLVIWQDENNFLQFGRAFCDVPDVCVGNGIYFDKVQDGNFTDSNFGRAVDNPSEAYLRLERRGDMVKAFYSYEGITWFEIGTHWIPAEFQVNGVGLTASQDYNTPDSDIPADFDFFELTEGWGFLPEGFHDGNQGHVPSWACNVSGWAADPDDRAADLSVEVDVDGVPLPDWLSASEYRQDLADAGVCVDGNCSFSKSLWETISPYEPHSIVTYAQDIPSGEWVQLSNSPKTLTCRSYDIYIFDAQTGKTRQLTTLRDSYEYNPRWSPDGKKIVHDVLSTDWSSHGIYITDVNTGVSTPLAGAESGSYPTWAPNDKWIAFDRGADNDYRLFIVPPTGGVQKLVTEDAFMATWAPNSQRLAFNRPSDGSIRTIDLKGGSETIVAEQGNGPAWSPDGEWIAFELNGDIWKVGVDNRGNPLGDPIRLTSSPLWEGRPTWSNNSKVIAFYAGMGQDTDIWTIPASGGTSTWLTGAPVFGDYDPNYSFNGRYIAYSSFSPDGQAARQWGAAFSYDAGAWIEGEHSYYFEDAYSVPEAGGETTDPIGFTVSSDAPSYDGYVLLRGAALRARLGEECPAIDPIIRPDQNTRFHYGWVTNTPMTYSEAVAHFNSMTVKAY